MSISANQLTADFGSTALTSYTTASVSPAANRLILVWVGHQVASGGMNATALSGLGLTWDLVDSFVDSTTGNRRVSLFRALSATTPTPGTLTISFASGQTALRCGWSVTEFGGVDTTGTNGANAIVQSARGETTDSVAATGVTATLAAFSGVNNATFCGLRYGVNGLPTVGTGFTLLGSAQSTASYFTEWKNSNDTTADWSWASSSLYNEAIAVEIKASTNTQGLLGVL